MLGLGLRVKGLGFRVKGLGVEGSGLKILRLKALDQDLYRISVGISLVAEVPNAETVHPS